MAVTQFYFQQSRRDWRIINGFILQFILHYVNIYIWYYLTPSCSTNTGSSNNSLELPVWIQRIEFIVLAVVSVIFLMTIVCVCRKCCLFWGCITGNKDDDIEVNRGRKKIPKGKVSAISNKESVMAMSLVNV